MVYVSVQSENVVPASPLQERLFIDGIELKGGRCPLHLAKEAGEDRHLLLMNALFSSLAFLSLHTPFTCRPHGSNRIHFLSLSSCELNFLLRLPFYAFL